MSIKRRIAIITLLLLLSITLFGCGSTPEDSGDNSAGDASGTESTTDPKTMDSDYLLGVLAKGSAAEGMSYDLTITAGGQVTKASYFMEGSKFKMMGSYGGVESVTIVDGVNMITYDPVQKTGMQFPYESSTDMSANPWQVDADLSDNFDTTALTYLENGEFDGQDCLIVSTRDIAGSGEMKMWISESLGMVVKMEGTAADGQIFSTELTNIKLGKLADDTFSVPSDIKLMEIPNV